MKATTQKLLEKRDFIDKIVKSEESLLVPFTQVNTLPKVS